MSEPKGTLDLMVDFAVAEVTNGDEATIKSLVRKMAQRWPQEKALCISFALCSAAAQIEELIAPVSPAVGPAVAYRVSSIVAADILAVEAMGQEPARCRDLLLFWRRVDPWFLAG